MHYGVTAAVCAWLCVVAVEPVCGATEAASPLAAGFQDLPWHFNHQDVALPVGSGAVPAWLNGTLYRVGPVRYTLEPAAPNVQHWFNGLGMLHAFRFAAGTVTYSNSYVPSDLYNATVPKTRAPATAAAGQASGRHEAAGAQPPSPASHNSMRVQQEWQGAAAAGAGEALVAPNTQVTVRNVAGHLLTNTGYSLSNEFGPPGTTWRQLPFQYPGKPLQPATPTAAPSHAQTDPSGRVVHYRFLFGQGGDTGYQLYTCAPDKYVPRGV